MRTMFTLPLLLQVLVEAAAAALQQQLSSALEKAALVEGLQMEVQTSQAATQRALVNVQMQSLTPFLLSPIYR